MPEPVQHPDLVEAVERVGRAWERGMGTRSHFHLSRCGGCSGPTFSQPCPHCSFYMQPDVPPAQRRRHEPLTAEGFRRAIADSMPDGRGNLATWYVGNARRTVAYQGETRHRGWGEPAPVDEAVLAFRAKVETAVADAATLEGLPDPDALFRAVTVEGASLHRPPATPEATHLWNAVFELRSALARDLEASARPAYAGARHDAVPERIRAEAEQGLAQAVEAIHGDDSAWEPALDAMGSAIDAIVAIGRRDSQAARWVPVGNLVSAKRALDAVREAIPSAAPAP